MQVDNDNEKLEQYISTLEGYRDRLCTELNNLTRLFDGLEWHDDFRNNVRIVLNKHIDVTNASIAKLNGMICSLRRMDKELIDYFDSALS